MTALPTLTLKHVHEDGSTCYVGAVSVQHSIRGRFPMLLIEVPGEQERRECYSGHAFLMNANGKTIEKFDMTEQLVDPLLPIVDPLLPQ